MGSIGSKNLWRVLGSLVVQYAQRGGSGVHKQSRHISRQDSMSPILDDITTNDD
jgi:hypothetical protein